MDRALALAERARGATGPNPAVGCVLARAGEIVGEGWTQPPGGPHAEVVALRVAGAAAEGATAYVTLEPCAHTGRTPPCADALRDAGVVRVVVATTDPNPEAAGGVAALRAAGVTVDVGLRGREARAQNEAFHRAAGGDRPHVTVKLAISLDGRVAAADGTSQWLTGPAARAQAHRLRAEVDAVLVGSGTVLADDPRLTVRGQEPQAASQTQPLRVVIDRRARTRADARVYDDAAPSLAIVGAGADAAHLGRAGVEVARLPAGGDDHADWHAALRILTVREVRAVLLEGGARLAATAMAAGCADRFAVHLAPVLLGDHARPALAGLAVPTLDAAPRFALTGAATTGDDVVLTYSPGTTTKET